jgi:hypothetical protein
VSDALAYPFFEPGALDGFLGVCLGQGGPTGATPVVQILTAPAFGAVAASTLELEDARRLYEQLGALLEAPR